MKEQIVSYSIRAHPEDHKSGHCDCSCFGRDTTLRVDGKTPTAFGRVVARDDTHVYVDWYEVFRGGQEPDSWHADPWPLEQYTEHVREPRR